MSLYLVTIKTPRNPNHNPHAKITAQCPAIAGATSLCTDSTGEHHTLLVDAPTATAARGWGEDQYGHVTRVEATTHIGRVE